MKSCGILFLTIFLLGFCVTKTEGLFESLNLQEYVNNVIDTTKFKLNGMLSLNDSTINRIWSFFKTRYGRAYSTVGEENQRIRIFREHLQYVLESNLQKLSTFQLELNEFADWSIDEFNLMKKGLIVSTSLRRRTFHEDSNSDSDSKEYLRRRLQKLYDEHLYQRRIKRSMIYRRTHERFHDRRGFIDWIIGLFNTTTSGGGSSDSFDWRTKNVVGSVKNQLNCGSCYAFATASVLESLYAIKTKSKTVTNFSPQQIVDCSSNGNNGCSGGNFGPSVRYVSGQGNKIATWDSYPYAGAKKTCQTNGIKQVDIGTIKYSAITQGDEKAMQQALVNYGPLFIGLDTSSRLFMFYQSGVLNINSCPNRVQDMDHAMVVVGYGYDSTLKVPYWIIKNSWAEKWGENGYVRLIKDKGNMCGIASMAYYATLT